MSNPEGNSSVAGPSSDVEAPGEQHDEQQQRLLQPQQQQQPVQEQQQPPPTALQVQAPQPRRQRVTLLGLLFCSGDPNAPSWQRLLSLSNTLSYLVLLFLNVLVYSGALWPALQFADGEHPPIATPAGWTYSIRDFLFFWFGAAVCCQNAVERRGWKEALLGAVGFSWQVIWYGECIWLVLYVTGTPLGLLLAPLFSAFVALAAVTTCIRVGKLLPELHADLQEEGWDGVPGVGYLLFVFPTSLAAGWFLVLQVHASVVAVSILTDDWATLVTAGCLLLAAATVAALVVIVRHKDVMFGLGFVFGMVGMMIGTNTGSDDLRPDQLVASFCAGIMQVAVAMLLYGVVSVNGGRATVGL